MESEKAGNLVRSLCHREFLKGRGGVPGVCDGLVVHVEEVNGCVGGGGLRFQGYSSWALAPSWWRTGARGLLAVRGALEWALAPFRGRIPRCTPCPCGPCCWMGWVLLSSKVSPHGLSGALLPLSSRCRCQVTRIGTPPFEPVLWRRYWIVHSHQIQSPVWLLRRGCWTHVPFWNSGYASGCGGASGRREDDKDARSEWEGGSGGADVGLGGGAGAGARAQAVRDHALDSVVVGGMGHLGGGEAYARVAGVVQSAGPASRVVSMLGFVGRGVHAPVFWLLVWAVCRVERGWPIGDMMQAWMREVSPCCPCVQGGQGVPLRLYGVRLVVVALVDEDVGGCLFSDLGGVSAVAGDVILAALHLQLVVCEMMYWAALSSWALSPAVLSLRWVWNGLAPGFFLGFCVRWYFGFDQVSWAPGPRGPYVGGCGFRSFEEGGGVGVQGWGLLAGG